MQDALDYFQSVVGAFQVQKQLGGRPKRLDGFVERLNATAGFGQTQVRQRIAGVQLDHFAEYLDGVAVAAGALESRRYLVPGGQGIASQAQLGIDVGQLGNDMSVAIGQIRRVLLDQLADLFVDRDGFERETLRGIELTDPVVRRDGRGIRGQPCLKAANLQKRASVVRILLNDPLVFHDRPVVLLFLDVLLGSLENLLALDGQGFYSDGGFGGRAETIRSAKSYELSRGWSR